MAKGKLKKGSKLMCYPCGREIVVNACGTSARTIWCCGAPMKKKVRTAKRKTKKRRKR